MDNDFKLKPKEKHLLLRRCLQGSTGFFAAALVCAMLAMLLMAATPQIVKFAVDCVLTDPAGEAPAFLRPLAKAELPVREALLVCAALVLATALARALCAFLQRFFLSRGSEEFVKALRDRLYRHIQYLPFAWHKANPTGDIIQRCTSDVDVIRNFVCNQLMEVFRTSLLIVMYMVIMFSMNGKLALLVLVYLPVVGLSSGLFFQKISRRFKAADEAEGALTTAAQENLTGVRVVRAFGRERQEEDKFRAMNERFSQLWIQLGKLLSVYWASGTLLTCLQIMSVVLAGVVLTVRGEMTLGTFLVFVSYSETMGWPVRSLGRVLSEMSKAGVSIDRVGYILGAAEETTPSAPRPVPDGDIEFDNVTFAYEDTPVLKNVSFRIKKGETFAILGGTGAGKSTAAHLLDRLYDLPPEGGSIRIGGTDLRDMSPGDLRRRIGIVLQEPFLFSRTIAENIRMARPEATDEEVRAAATVACVDEAISVFPEGYNTIVGERGVTLSGGQKQRVAIARMLLQKAPILVFDDSLSAVDTETDEKIRSALRDTLSESTVILISHRITTLMQADRILVLEDGRVADLGTHAELISRPGLYKTIYDIQMQRDDRILLEEGGAAHAGL